MDPANLKWALQNGDLEELEKLGPEAVNAKIDGRTPLHIAADYGQVDVIKYLLSKGADVNSPDSYDMTPLLAAIFEGHTKCVQLLLSKGAKKCGKAPDGRPYIECAESDQMKCLLK